MNETLGIEKFYISVHPQIFRIDTIRTFDIFAKNSEGRVSLFHSAGDIYSAEQHGKIFKHNIPALFIRIIDKGRYTKYLEENFPFIMQDPFISLHDKAEISHEVLSLIAMTIFSSPGTEIILSFKKAIEEVTNFVLWNDEASKFLIQLTSSSFNEYNHAVNVGILGLGLAKEVLTGNEDYNIPEIVAGFFLHDLGKFTIPKHISRRNGPLTPEEWAIMKRHPEQGYRILQKFGALTEEAAYIVLQHHERNDGKGYPVGLKSDKIHPYSKICTIADVFDALTSQRPYRTPKSSFHALGIMQNEMKNEFDGVFFAHFVRLFSRA